MRSQDVLLIFAIAGIVSAVLMAVFSVSKVAIVITLAILLVIGGVILAYGLRGILFNFVKAILGESDDEDDDEVHRWLDEDVDDDDDPEAGIDGREW